MLRKIKINFIKIQYFKKENKLIIKFFFLFIFLFSLLLNSKKIRLLIINEFSNYSISIDNNEKNNIIFFISNLTYLFSLKHNKILLKYNINFLNNKNNLIKPSDVALFYEIHIICNMNSHNNLNNINIMPYVFQNQQLKCIHYFSVGEKNLKFGIIIYLKNIENKKIFLFNKNIIDYNNLNHKNDDIYYLKSNNIYYWIQFI